MVNSGWFAALSNEEWFVNGVFRKGQDTKRRLIEMGVPEVCANPTCPSPNPEWDGKPLVLQLDHIDGNNLNNAPGNHRLLCPNCHTQTDTYSRNSIKRKIYRCKCGTEIQRRSRHCRPCAVDLRREANREGKS